MPCRLSSYTRHLLQHCSPKPDSSGALYASALTKGLLRGQSRSPPLPPSPFLRREDSQKSGDRLPQDSVSSEASSSGTAGWRVLRAGCVSGSGMAFFSDTAPPPTSSLMHSPIPKCPRLIVKSLIAQPQGSGWDYECLPCFLVFLS